MRGKSALIIVWFCTFEFIEIKRLIVAFFGVDQDPPSRRLGRSQQAGPEKSKRLSARVPILGN
jgi:hypothetical protein